MTDKQLKNNRKIVKNLERISDIAVILSMIMMLTTCVWFNME